MGTPATVDGCNHAPVLAEVNGFASTASRLLIASGDQKIERDPDKLHRHNIFGTFCLALEAAGRAVDAG
jgi:hypothetical protein